MDDLEQYAQRDHQAQGEHYLRHVSAMTGGGLHAKSAIAGELAHRDIEIARLTAERDALQAKLDAAEPVAWRYRYHAKGSWYLAGEPSTLDADANDPPSPGFEQEPLYRAPPDFAALQRRYDALMMECCPDAMTDEQRARWGKSEV